MNNKIYQRKEKMRNGRPVLLVDDDQYGAMLLQRALEINHIKNPLSIVGNGVEALKHLRDPEKEKPCLILLDLNMPKMNGMEFLKIVKQNDTIRRIPIVILTTSQEEGDIKDCFDLGAAGYMIKPVDFNKFVEMVNALYRYWSLCEMT